MLEVFGLKSTTNLSHQPEAWQSESSDQSCASHPTVEYAMTQSTKLTTILYEYKVI